MIATMPTKMKVTTAGLSFSCSSLSQGCYTAGKRPIQVSMYAHESKALDGNYRLASIIGRFGITRKLALPDASQDGPQNQKESKPPLLLSGDEENHVQHV